MRLEPAVAVDPPTFTATYATRFDEADAGGHLRPSAYLRYAQDLAWRHSVAAGFDAAWYASTGFVWLVRGIRLEIADPVPERTEVSATTTIVGQRRIWARRRVTIRPLAPSSPADPPDPFAPDAAPAATLDADWILLDPRGRPLTIGDRFAPTFEIPPLDAPMDRLELPPAPPDAARLEREVRPSELDPMAHVNNAVYVDWLDDALRAGAATAAIAGSAIRAIRVEYLAPAVVGDAVTVRTWPGSRPADRFVRIETPESALALAVATLG